MKIISASVLPKLFSRSLSMVVGVWYHGFLEEWSERNENSKS